MKNMTTFKVPYLTIYVKSYLIETENYNIFIDSSLQSNKSNLYPILKNGKKNVLLLTHGHWDHIGLNSVIGQEGGLIYGHPADMIFIMDFDWHWQMGFGQFVNDMEIPPERKEIFWREIGKPTPVDYFLKDGEELIFDNLKLKVLELPGHSRGSVGYYNFESDVLFTGDALMGTGFFGGMAQYCDYKSYLASMDKIAELDPKTIYTSHTDPMLDGLGGKTALEAKVFAQRVKRRVEEYIKNTEGSIILGEIASYISEKEGKKMGGGACVTVLNHLNDMRNQDYRIEQVIKSYIRAI